MDAQTDRQTVRQADFSIPPLHAGISPITFHEIEPPLDIQIIDYHQQKSAHNMGSLSNWLYFVPVLVKSLI